MNVVGIRLSMSKLRFALVGTGNIAKQHVKAIIACGHELAGVCNLTGAKAMDFMNSFAGQEGVAPAVEGATVFTEVSQMLDILKPDVVYVTTPHLSHIDIACLAVRRGIHCIIEKPLDISLAKAHYLLEESQRTKALVSVIAQSRFFPCTERVKNAIDDGKIGTPALGVVSVQSWRDQAYYESNGWRGSWTKEGGGVLVNQAVHELDLLCYFLGEVQSVYGIWRNVNHPYIEVEDTAQAIVTFKSGASANVLVSNSIYPPQDTFVHIMGSTGDTLGVQTHGGLEANAGTAPSSFRPFNDIFSLYDEEKRKSYLEKDYAEISDESWSYYFFAEQIKELAKAIENQKNGIKVRLRSTIKDAVGSMMIAQGIYLSQREGRMVTAKEILDDSMNQLTHPQPLVEPKTEPKAESSDEPQAEASPAGADEPAAEAVPAAAADTTPAAATPETSVQ